LGVTEYLFRNETLLDEVINTAIEDNTFRSDDLEFTFAARVSNIPAGPAGLFRWLTALEISNYSHTWSQLEGGKHVRL
jgi:hypothetical protein